MAFALSDMELTSPAFQPGENIPREHTGEGENISPPLEWKRAPDGTRSFALVCHDPDAPLVSEGAYGFVHWVLYNVPASVTSLQRARVTIPAVRLVSAKTATVGRCRRRATAGTTTSSGCSRSVRNQTSRTDSPFRRSSTASNRTHSGMNRLVGTYERT